MGSRFSKLLFLFTLRSVFKVDFQYRCTGIHFETQNYTWSRLFKLMYSSSNFEIYLKQTFNDVFILKLWNLLELNSLNIGIGVQTQKYIWSRFPKSIISFQTQKYTWSIFHFRKSQQIYIKYYWSINKVSFYFFLFLYFIYTSF